MSALFLDRPQQPLQLDATQMGLTEAQLDALPWGKAFGTLRAVEAGEVCNPDEGRMVGHYWLRAPERSPTVAIASLIGEALESVLAFIEGVQSGRICAADGLPFTDLLHVGIGGSALGPQLLVDALTPRPGGLTVHFLDNTDPDGIARTLDALDDRLGHTLVHVVSKSGATPETATGLALVQRRLAERGYSARAQLVATTQDGSKLHQRAISERWLATFPMWDWVGGRFSITSAVGLLPAGLAGVDVQALLAGARDMDEWSRIEAWRDNPAALMAGCWHVAGGGHGERANVTLPYSDRLTLLSRYMQQLVMESVGKERDLAGKVVHQGLTVYGNKGSTDQHAFVQQLRDGRDDFFVTFVQVLGDGAGEQGAVDGLANAGDYLQGFLLGTRRALAESGRPSLTLTVPEVDARTVGALVALLERTVGLYAALIGVNAYHQPGVEAGKRAAREILSLSERVQAALSDEPVEAAQLAEQLGAAPVEVAYLLQRLALTERAVSVGFPARYSRA